MKTRDPVWTHSTPVIRGWTDPLQGYPATDAIRQMLNSSGVALVAGDVVVVDSAGEITTTTTAQDTRVKGVVLDDIADGEYGPVAFEGPVDLVNVTASVSAGSFAETSTTAKKAQANADIRTGSFGYFTSSGTTPSAYLFGAGGGESLASLLDEFLTSATGERHVTSTVAATGAAETLDLETANTFDLTLDTNCTLTFSNPPSSGVEGRWRIILRQDGTGGRTVTWPASVVWRDIDGTSTTSAPDLATAADAVDVVEITTLDGGATYGASLENGSGVLASPLTTKGDLWGYSTLDDRVPVGTDGYVLTADSTDAQGLAYKDPTLTVGGSDHAHVASETHLSDGSTVTWTLDQAFMTGSVIAWNTTSLARLDVTEVEPDQATVSAAGTTGDKIVFDYAAVVV